ncbi:PAS domain-containing protein [Kordiimonas marina]|uniref:PAS domain-containing protein n=1 Tax=Kordiimonas marina TaxID=2872312 RepID=UPI0031BB0C50|nr:PAS domain-containing protein [Kordiimonas marina]
MSPELCQFLRYWRSLGGGDRVPDRNQLDLRKLTSLLSWMFILEMGKEGALRYRLSGSSLEGAVGCGMSGRVYADIFADHDQAALMEELYAVALVQSCGILRTGAFSLASGRRFDLEVLVLPFAEPRVMGGTELVGVVRPFDYQNQGFIDKWGGFEHEINSLLVVPSPRILTPKHLSPRVLGAMDRAGLEMRALDMETMLELDRLGVQEQYPDVPSLSLDAFDGPQEQSLN